jgi:hypothetical protein
MKRLQQWVTALILVLLAGASGAAAQSAKFGLGGGLVVPTSDYNTLDKTGWHVLGKVDIGIPMSPIGVRVDALYGQTSHRSPATGNTKLAGGMAGAVWHVPTAVPGFKPYLLGGIGFYNVKTDTSVTKFTWGGGVGTSVGVGPIHGFGEARYMSIQASGGSLKFFLVTVGLAFGSK